MQQPVSFLKKITIKLGLILNRLLASGLMMRGFYMGLFFIIANILRSATTIISMLQFLIVVIKNKHCILLLKISEKLCAYGHKVDSFPLFNTDHKPFPFKAKTQN
ncbi:DUF4389 domain-containing protein [Legionella sp. 29fVS95]|uniref:DUF4389 domain-containing protein n=1 Tax=Legionella sp. 29fVS95 TaxID=3402813 RepID=UPI003AF9A5BC